MNVTLTGLDISTPTAGLLELLDRYPRLEIAILYTETPEGRHRYMARELIRCTLKALRALSRPAALHVCGSLARNALIFGEHEALFRQAGRIQINGHIPTDHLLAVCDRYRDHQIITQCRNLRDPLIAVNRRGSPPPAPGPLNHAILLDSSGGRGKVPAGEGWDRWTRPDTPKAVGFAGGLSYQNLERLLPPILKQARPGDWIDAETGVRDADDWFSLRKANLFCETAALWSEP